MVASRFISAKLKFQGNVAAVSIAVSFLVIIIAVAVSDGFRHEVRNGVAAMAGDIRISPYAGSDSDPVPMQANFPERDAVLALPGVKALEESVVRAGIVKSGETVHGVIVKGIPGAADGALGVSIPHRLQEITGLGVGDAMTTYFIGEKVKVRKFTVTAIHRDILEADDNLIVYAGIDDMRRLSGWDSTAVSCIDVVLKDRFRDRSREEAAAWEISSILADERLSVVPSVRAYPELFDWLDLLDSNVLFILVLMILVAGFNMISGLLIMLLRNVSLIGTLKTMGMGDREVGNVFLRVGSGVVLKGMLAGNALALLFCLVQGLTHAIPLDPENYFVSFVPVHVDFLKILLADAAAYAGILLLLWLPSRLVSRVDPARTVKAD